MNANDEMIQGYMDGLDLSLPEPSDNRTHSYRHGFANGRVDRDNRCHWPRVSVAWLNAKADAAMEADENR